MSSCKLTLRPHHGLCISFFEGRGYSEEFTANMTEKIALLKDTDPKITLVCGADMICAACPHNKGGVCESGGKSDRYDKAVLDMCGFTEGQVLSASEFFSAVEENILAPQRLREVCGDCSWADICFK